jgi:hypothetical protein
MADAKPQVHEFYKIDLKDEPEFLQKHHKKHGTLSPAAEIAEDLALETYTAAKKKVLYDSKGKFHKEWLVDGDGKKSANDIVDDLANAHMDIYREKVKKLVAKEHQDDQDLVDGFVQSLYGVSLPFLKTRIGQNRRSWTATTYSQQVAPALYRHARERRDAVAADHFSQDDANSLLKHIPDLEARVSAMSVDEARAVANRIEENGRLTPEDIDEIFHYKAKGNPKKKKNT